MRKVLDILLQGPHSFIVVLPELPAFGVALLLGLLDFAPHFHQAFFGGGGLGLPALRLDSHVAALVISFFQLTLDQQLVKVQALQLLRATI